MGVVNANVVISNPADRSRSWEGRFVIDTSATSVDPVVDSFFVSFACRNTTND